MTGCVLTKAEWEYLSGQEPEALVGMIDVLKSQWEAQAEALVEARRVARELIATFACYDPAWETVQAGWFKAHPWLEGPP